MAPPRRPLLLLLLPLLPLALLALGSVASAAPCSACRLDPGLFSGVPSACETLGLEITSWSRLVSINASDCDMEVLRSEFNDQPEVRYPDADPDMWYTLMVLDPDAMFMRPGEYWLHWLVLNIKGNHFQMGYMDEATEVASYVAPSPAENSGAHRILFVAFEQSPFATPLAPTPPPQRPHFPMAAWVAEQRALCGPVAAFQFRTAF